jgi:hypothetical protein
MSDLKIIKTKDDYSFKFTDLKFKKEKDKIGEYNKSYSIRSNENKKIIFHLKNILLPYGIENYKLSKILNINIDVKRNEEHSMYYNMIDELETELKKHLIDSSFEDKKYVSSLKKHTNGYILRTHVYTKPDIYIMLGKYKNTLSFNELKKAIANVDIELSLVWLFDEKYGIVWTVKNIEVTNYS